jgi:hypothetical protein
MILILIILILVMDPFLPRLIHHLLHPDNLLLPKL